MALASLFDLQNPLHPSLSPSFYQILEEYQRILVLVCLSFFSCCPPGALSDGYSGPVGTEMFIVAFLRLLNLPRRYLRPRNRLKDIWNRPLRASCSRTLTPPDAERRPPKR